MIWACFPYYGFGLIYSIPGIMDQFAYAKKLEKDMPLKWLFQQDNVPNQVLVPNKHLVME